MIIYFCGPEGGGKTALMTRYNRIHHLMGGECWSFPGYELLNERGRAVSKLVMPEEIMGLLDDMQYVVLSIDEITNFMNHHHWADKMVDIMTYGAAAQRRKREFVIMATGPMFNWLPHDLRQMFHEVVYCTDKHWRNHSIKRGQQIEFYREDKRGVLSGRIGSRTRPQTFWAERYFKYFNTFSLIDPKYQFHKLRVKQENVLIDSSGNIIPKKEGITDPATLERYIKDYGTNHQDLVESARQVLAKLKSEGINIVDKSIIYQSLGASPLLIGKALSSLGARLRNYSGTYDISGVLL